MKLSEKKIKVNQFFFDLKKILKKKKKPFFLHEPYLDRQDENYVAKCVKSKFISTAGTFTKKFEDELKKFTKSKYVLSVINGTAALHLALVVLNIKENEEILIPSMTFVATGNAVLYNKSIPHFFDINEDLTINLIKLNNYLEKNTKIKNGKCVNKNTNRIISAIIPMHTFGHMSDMSKLKKLAKKFKLLIIEDAAEALGSFYRNKHAGTFGKIGTLSFNGNKIVTTGMGGAILTNNKKLYLKARHLAATAKVKSKWDYIHDVLGYNYRLPSLNAAIGYSQMKKINFLISKKRKLFQIYKKAFKGSNFFTLISEQPNTKSNYWLQTVVLKPKFKDLTKMILSKCYDNKIYIRPVWKPLHKLNYFKKFPKMNLDKTNSLYLRVINLPSSSILSK